MNRLMITGTASGCGKTTVVCALLAAFKARGVSPVAFKCGPDYIDPMFHRAASGVAAYNLDAFFMAGNELRGQLARFGPGPAGVAVLEGAMGFYDGIAATDEASAYTVARETYTPAVLVVSAKASAASLGAVIEGFARHRPDSHLRGVIFNDAESRRYPDLKRIAANAGVRAFGHMPRRKELTVPSRHLGLMTPDEISSLESILAALGEEAERSLDIGGLLTLAASAPELKPEYCAPPPPAKAPGRGTVRLAVARDEAFCFVYAENLLLLKNLGCEPVFFSPLKDSGLPEGISGLYLCGGYPEIHLNELSENLSMRSDIKRAVTGGLPTVAECGGFMYLHESLDGKPMCAALRGAASETREPVRFGYLTLTAGRDNLLCKAGESIRAHELHYWESDNPGGGFSAKKAGRESEYRCAHATPVLYAGFPQLYFPANPAFAVNFADRMFEYDLKRNA
jgi:cobyrinic acid a,c-diamide synthase